MRRGKVVRAYARAPVGHAEADAPEPPSEDSESEPEEPTPFLLVPSLVPQRARREIIMLVLPEVLSSRVILRARLHDQVLVRILPSLAQSLRAIWLAIPAWRDQIDDILRGLLDVDAAVLVLCSQWQFTPEAAAQYGYGRGAAAAQGRRPVSATAVLERRRHGRALFPLLLSAHLRHATPRKLALPADLTVYDPQCRSARALKFATWHARQQDEVQAFTFAGISHHLLAAPPTPRQHYVGIVAGVCVFLQRRGSDMWRRAQFGDSAPTAIARASLLEWALDPIARTPSAWRCSALTLPVRLGYSRRLGLQAYAFPPGRHGPECVRVLVVRREATVPDQEGGQGAQVQLLPPAVGTDGFLHMSPWPPFESLSTDVHNAELHAFRMAQTGDVRVIDRMALELLLDVRLAADAASPDVLGSLVTQLHWLSRGAESAVAAHGAQLPTLGTSLRDALQSLAGPREPAAQQQGGFHAGPAPNAAHAPQVAAAVRRSAPTQGQPPGFNFGDQQLPVAGAFAFGSTGFAPPAQATPGFTFGRPERVAGAAAGAASSATTAPATTAFSFGSMPQHATNSAQPSFDSQISAPKPYPAPSGIEELIDPPPVAAIPASRFTKRSAVFPSAANDSWVWEYSIDGAKPPHALWLAV